MHKFISLTTAVSVAMISLTGCGGSSDSTTTSTSNTQTGYFIDAEVKGLNYKTSSGKTGKTNNLGQFFYKPGDSVSFSIGNLQLGNAQPKSDGLVTPKDLAQEAASNNPEKAVELETLILRLLQSLDVDGNPSNGITINPRLVDNLNNIQETAIIDNTESSILDIDNNLRGELDENNDGVIDVSESDAKAHADQSLSDWENGIKPGDDHGTNQGTNQGTQSSLTNNQKYSLAYMWNEERLAKDIYLALNDLFPTKQFENIANKSETKHIEAVENLVKKYDINILNLIDYTVSYSESELRALPAGTYAIDTVQNLYNDLYAKGEQSKIDALQVGCMVEVTDVDDLDKFIKVAESVNADDLISVYTSLRAGSYNHYWAFDKALKNEGVSDGCASLGSEFAKTEAEYPSNHDDNDNDNGNGNQGTNNQNNSDSEGNHQGNTNTDDNNQDDSDNNNNSDGGNHNNNNDSEDTHQGNNGQGSTGTTNTSSSQLTNDQKYSLAYMWNEERLAKDIYLALNDVYPSNQFANIATKSEVKHVEAVESLVAKYDINILNLVDYSVNYSEAELRALPAGTYGVDSIQKLYDDLYAKGVQSKVDALQVACMVEVTDVNDLDTFIDVAENTNASDLVSVFSKLRAGSYNHYWAFDKALKKEGIANGCASLGAEYAKTKDEYPSSQGENEQGQGQGNGNGNGRGKGRG